MEADFSGYATKAGLKCSDGRTIMPDAFKHQDTMKVPLVWQHGHNDPENVLGHAILENRQDGVYCYGFFNETTKAKHAQRLVDHKDITMMSIWANQLIERAKNVLHGVIREVSLVLSGANPGALIDNVAIRHSDDGEDTVLEDEAIIYTGLEFEHSVGGMGTLTNELVTVSSQGTGKGNDKTVQAIYDSMTDEQQQLLHLLVGDAASLDGSLKQDDLDDNNDNKDDDKEDKEDKDDKEELKHHIDDVDDTKKGSGMKHNVFEDKDKDNKGPILSHDDMKAIISDASKNGSLKDAVTDYALAHGITDIEVLFPDAVNLDTTPQFLQRRIEWVGSLLGAVRKSPFSRIKTIWGDLTFEEARAKGYVKGTLKKEEFFGVTHRETTPTTIYKKQALDRDDVVDITDFDVVVWLKGEMRIMLDEELARAVLIGDGRDIAHEDKINEGNIRPIAKEHEVFATTIYVNIDDANSSVQEVIDNIVANRKFYKGTGQPTMFTSESMISMFLLLRDTVGRRIYKSLDEVASELRVAGIVPVEAMEDDVNLVAIIVNPIDYVLGATAGGQVNMFDDFDIDYNKQKYLIETRCAGALTRLKSALIVRKVASSAVLVAPNSPAFNSGTGAITITNQTGVVYKNADTNAVMNAAGSPYTVASGMSLTVVATPASGYYFGTTEDDTWTFVAD